MFPLQGTFFPSDEPLLCPGAARTRGAAQLCGKNRCVVVGAASLIAAVGHLTPRAGDHHPALLARHVISMLKTTRSSFPACLMINSFHGYSAEVETRAEYVGGTTVVRDRIACKPAILAETDDYVAMASEYQALAGLPGIKSARLWEPDPGEVYVWGHSAHEEMAGEELELA